METDFKSTIMRQKSTDHAKFFHKGRHKGTLNITPLRKRKASLTTSPRKIANRQFVRSQNNYYKYYDNIPKINTFNDTMTKQLNLGNHKSNFICKSIGSPKKSFINAKKKPLETFYKQCELNKKYDEISVRNCESKSKNINKDFLSPISKVSHEFSNMHKVPIITSNNINKYNNEKVTL